MNKNRFICRISTHHIHYFFLTFFILSACAHAEPSKRIDPSRPDYLFTSSFGLPKNAETMEKLRNDLRQRFLNHIKGARNIKMPFEPKDFNWKVDQKAQKKYCHSIAEALFGQNSRLKFPVPEASLLRDGAAKAGHAIQEGFPACHKPEHENWPQKGQWRAEGLGRAPNNNDWDYDFYVGSNYFVTIEYGIAGTVNDVITAPVVATYEWARPGESCPIKEMSFSEDADFGRNNILLVGFIDDKPMLFRYGIYDNSFKADEHRSYQGKPGQKYVLVESPDGDPFLWALSPPPDVVRGNSFDIWREAQSNNLSSCVINFD